jgi:hypothetical protein
MALTTDLENRAAYPGRTGEAWQTEKRDTYLVLDESREGEEIK